MARGTPDDGLQPYQFASQISDPGLIYQMLWGFAPIDGQGRIIYLETFNNGLGGLNISAGGAGTYALSNDAGKVYSPPYSLKVTVPGIGSAVNIDRKIYLGQNKRIGVECSLLISSTTPDFTFESVYKANVSPFIAYRGLISWKKTGYKWVLTTASGDVDLKVLGSPPFPMFIQIKYVMDFITGKYVRAFIGDELIDISAYSLPVVGALYSGLFYSTLGFAYNDPAVTSTYLGYVLFTKDEP